MSLFRNIVLAAVIAGLLSGLLLTAMQSLSTIPLIAQAEVFEKSEDGGHSHGHAADATAPAAHQHEHQDEAWEPADGAERFIYTAAADILSAIGFALVLLAMVEASGRSSGWRSGMLFGIAGFTVVILAPGLGLPPELPGMPAAELGPRQIWWISTAACTAIGIGIIAFTRSALFAAVAIVLLVLPHLIGAPVPPTHETSVPPDLYARFVNAVYATNLVFWAVLGALAGTFRQRFRAGEETPVGSSRELAA